MIGHIIGGVILAIQGSTIAGGGVSCQQSAYKTGAIGARGVVLLLLRWIISLRYKRRKDGLGDWTMIILEPYVMRAITSDTIDSKANNQSTIRSD